MSNREIEKILYNFANNISQWIVLYHPIMNNKTISCGVQWNIFLTFYTNIHSSALYRFVLARTIDHYEWTVYNKFRDR